MTDKINGRTPEEIKNGLECCKPRWTSNRWATCRDECPFRNEHAFCRNVLMSCVSLLIQQLEAKNAQLQELCDNLDLALVKQTRQLAEKELILLKTVEEFVEKTPKWISVEERLPPVGERVLACIAKRHVCEAFIGCEDVWYRTPNCSEIKNTVTHWMPLPPAPEVNK